MGKKFFDIAKNIKTCFNNGTSRIVENRQNIYFIKYKRQIRSWGN